MMRNAHKIGAVMYIVWGLLHLKAAQAVFQLGSSLEPGLVQARVYQDAFSLLFFALVAIVVAVRFNWKNSENGYWINLITVSAADIGFLIFVLVPGIIPIFPAILGPVFWILAALFSTIGYRFREQRSALIAA